MNWHQIESQDQRGLVVHFTNDQPNTDFSISNKCVDKYVIAVHSEGHREGEFLKVVFRTLEDAKAHAEELSKTENASVDAYARCDKFMDALIEYIASSRLLGERESSA